MATAVDCWGISYEPSMIEISHGDCGGLLGDLIECIIIFPNIFAVYFFLRVYFFRFVGLVSRVVSCDVA